MIKSKFLSVSSMNTLLAILKVTDARRDVILAGGLYHRFPWRHPPPPLPPYVLQNQFISYDSPAHLLQLLTPQSLGKGIPQTIIFRASENGLMRVEGTGNASSPQRFIRLLHSRGDSLSFLSTEKGKITQNQT